MDCYTSSFQTEILLVNLNIILHQLLSVGKEMEDSY